MAGHPARGEARAPEQSNELLRRGAALLNAGHAADAVRVFQQLVALHPDNAHVHHRLGDAAAWAGDLPTATEALRRSVRLDPSNAPAWGRLGNVLRSVRDLEGAIDAFSRALAIEPDSVPLMENLGEALVTAARPLEAIPPLECALKRAPDHPIAHLNLASALMRLRHIDQALLHFERAVQIKPDLAQAHLNLGMACLMRGDCARGWDEMEWRLERASQTQSAGSARPRWHGEPLAGKRILLYAEQGYGDAIQFARYVPLVAQRGGRVFLRCRKELARLLASAGAIENVVRTGDALPEHDVQCPLMSLPLVFGSTLENLPREVPYLRAPGELSARWADRLRELPRPRVGIAWAGNPSNTRDRYRSMSFEQIAPLLESQVTWVSLQKDGSADPLRASSLNTRVMDPTAELHDWADTAALVENLDLIITVDTGVAHLAGAVGKQTWTMLSFGADWRWLLDRDDSPWYPTMRLFRQDRLGDWEDVIKGVSLALAELSGAHTSLP